MMHVPKFLLLPPPAYVGAPEGWQPHLREILDLPLHKGHTQVYRVPFHVFPCVMQFIISLHIRSDA